MNQAARLLGYVPFLTPIPIHETWWLLLPPLAILIAVVWKTLRVEHLHELPRQAGVLAVQIILFMVLAGVGLWLLVELV